MGEVSNSSLKMKNRTAIWTLVVIDGVLLGIGLFGDSYVDISFSEKSTVMLLLASTAGPIIAGFMNELISPSIKAMLVFWRLTDVLPGHRAFSEIVDSDPRIDVSNLRKRIKGFPDKPKKQNQVWYSLYRKHEKDIRIEAVHQSFLLYRDCASLTLLFGGIVTACSIFFELEPWQILFLIFGFTLQYGLCVVVARNTGKRFVQSVLVAESLLKT